MKDGRRTGWCIFIISTILSFSHASAGTLRVGSGQDYPTLSAALAAVQDGDTILLEKDDVACTVKGKSFTLIGVGGNPTRSIWGTFAICSCKVNLESLSIIGDSGNTPDYFPFAASFATACKNYSGGPGSSALLLSASLLNARFCSIVGGDGGNGAPAYYDSMCFTHSESFVCAVTCANICYLAGNGGSAIVASGGSRLVLDSSTIAGGNPGTYGSAEYLCTQHFGLLGAGKAIVLKDSSSYEAITPCQISDGSYVGIGGVDINGSRAGLIRPSLGLRFQTGGPASTVLSCAIPGSGNMSLGIFNLRGKECAVLFSGYRKAGVYRAVWCTTGVQAGVYICNLRASCGSISKKILVIK